MRKFLLVLFIVLILVVAVEVFFYFYVSQKTPSVSTTGVQQANESVTLPISPSALNEKEINTLFSGLAKSITQDQAEFFKAGQLTSLIIRTEYNTKIISTSDKPVTSTDVQQKPVEYAATLTIQKGKNGSSPLFLSKNDLSKIKITDNRSLKRARLNFSDLKSGDDIKLILSFNVLKPLENNLVSGEIIRL